MSTSPMVKTPKSCTLCSEFGMVFLVPPSIPTRNNVMYIKYHSENIIVLSRYKFHMLLPFSKWNYLALTVKRLPAALHCPARSRASTAVVD